MANTNLKVGEYGRLFRYSTGYNMASETEITIKFVKPDESTVSKVTADGIVVGAGVTDPTLGVLAASEYVDYTIESGLLDQAGAWQAQLTYDDADPKSLIADAVSFTVDAVI